MSNKPPEDKPRKPSKSATKSPTSDKSEERRKAGEKWGEVLPFVRKEAKKTEEKLDELVDLLEGEKIGTDAVLLTALQQVDEASPESDKSVVAITLVDGVIHVFSTDGHANTAFILEHAKHYVLFD